MKLKGKGDGETFQDEAARQTESSLNLYPFICGFFFSECGCAGVFVRRTEQDGDDRHHAAAEGVKDALHWIGEVRGIDGDKEIESEEHGSCEQKRKQA